MLRVDELRKLGGVPCPELAPEGRGCGRYATRPRICRAYRCLWLQGSLDEADRPDRLGAVLDLVSEGGTTRLAIAEIEPGAFDRSPRLREIAERFRSFLPVRISDNRDVLAGDAPFRVLLPGGEEHRVAGEWTRVFRQGREAEHRRLPWLERGVRRALLRLRARRLRGYPPVS